MLVITLSLLGGLIYRMRGGLSPRLPRPLDQLLFALPFGYLAYLYFPFDFHEYDNYLVALIVLALTTVAVAKGHGRNMDLSYSHKPNAEVEPEWYEFVIKPLQKKTSEYWYDVIGMGVSGFTYTVPCSIATANPLIALSGFLKAPAYMIGWWMHNKFAQENRIQWLPGHFNRGTEIGEFLTGVFLWGIAVLWV